MLSSICNAEDFTTGWYARWAGVLGVGDRSPHRKYWEWAAILETLDRAGLLATGRRGLGFGCGDEPLAAALASLGVTVVATDFRGALEQGWNGAYRGQVSNPGICPPATLKRLAIYREADMNALPDDLADFDFCWSSCALEHLGSRRHGVDFVLAAMRTLRPGGLAAHTTEYSFDDGFDGGNLNAYGAGDLGGLVLALREAGCAVDGLDLTEGAAQANRGIVLPGPDHDPIAYGQGPLRLEIHGRRCTSVLIAARRPAEQQE